MFDNLINTGDLFRLVRQLQPTKMRKTLSQILKSRTEKTTISWQHIQSPPIHWWDIPEVRKRWSLLVTGEKELGFEHYLHSKYLAGRVGLKALSLGCGTGEHELVFAQLGGFHSIQAYDISLERVERAYEKAQQMKLGDVIDFHIGDVGKIDYSEEQYDVAWVNQSLHHCSPVSTVLARINRALKSDGLFFVNEFVGPCRFQWTARQLEAIEALLTLLPQSYRREWGTGRVKTTVVRPSRLSMVLSDPSEAPESAQIPELLRRTFEIVEFKEYGGTLLHMLFHGIAHNFQSLEPETKSLLQFCFEAEDLLMASKEVGSDFVMAICKKRA